MVKKMKTIEFANYPKFADDILKDIKSLSKKLKEEIKIMEVCGTHTQVISKSGIRRVIPENVKLISGPGCPVCVTPTDYIEKAIALLKKGYWITTFGDLMRVPSMGNSLEKEKAKGGRVSVVYSPLDALNIAISNRDESVVFLAVGFETTIPSICATIKKSAEEKIPNFKIFSAHKVIPPPLEVLAKDPSLKIDGFICPGHVSVIIGSKVYDFLPNELGKGAVVSGFEVLDILLSIKELIKQKVEGKPKNVNNYKRAVKDEGNKWALTLIETFFEKEDSNWRGLGIIKNSGLKLKKEWREFEVSLNGIEEKRVIEPQGCKCGDVLKGVITPKDCPLMEKVCTPDNPVGACMVSSEGSCAAYYKYERGLDG